jgi:predicted GTPase
MSRGRVWSRVSPLNIEKSCLKWERKTNGSGAKLGLQRQQQNHLDVWVCGKTEKGKSLMKNKLNAYLKHLIFKG